MTWHTSLRQIAMLTMLSLCAACSGGATGKALATGPVPAVAVHSSITVSLIVGGQHSSAANVHRRKPAFISADTAGVTLAFSGTANATQVVDVAPGATACAGSMASPRSCQVTLALPLGTYAVVATSYNAAPIASAIPASAHELATGTVTGVTIAAGRANVVSLYLSGLVAAVGAPAFISVPADGASHQVGLALAPVDFDNEPITAGANDPYTNPITLTLTESGGSGHESLIKNGANVGSNATVTQSSDAVQVQYDGAGSPGYTANVSISASGITSQTLYISPLYVVPATYASGNTLHFTAANETSTLTILEQSAPSSVLFTVTLTGCTGIAGVGSVTGNGASAGATVTSGSTISAAGCSLSVADSAGSGTVVSVPITKGTFVPTIIPNDILWLDAADTSTLTLSAGAVSRWVDKSGVLGDATQASIPNRPTAVPSAINGVQALSFTGNSSFLSNNNVSLGPTWSIFVVATMTSTNNYPDLFTGSSGETFGYSQNTSQPFFSPYSGSNWVFSGNVPLAQPQLLEAIWSNGSAQSVSSYAFFSSANTDNSGTTVDYATASTKYIVGSADNGFFGLFFPGYIGEIVLVQRAITTVERQQLEGYLAWKWGLTANLPAGHPYKQMAP